ncbi:MAG: MATE family efflux transporter [Clostridia bacterium]|nr:MATE family efflux transporter [Clostridia bacterium]
MLGEMPMGKLIPKVSIPIMISMLVQAMYNVVDSIFVAKYDPNALTAVSLAYPVQMLMIALSVGMGVGINSLISRKLGERKREDAQAAAWNGMLIELGGFVLFCLVGLFLARACMGMVVSDNLADAELIRETGTRYLHIVTTYSLGVFMAVLMERMLQSTGNTTLSMLTQIAGAVTNIILDPILIFGYLGLPSMGVTGAAFATVIGQHVSALTGFLLNQKKNPELRLALRDFRVNRGILRGILAVGLPSTIMQAIASVMNVGMNGLLSSFAEGNAAVNVLNVYFKLQSFVFMPVFGLGNGMVAIIGYNFGARLKSRVYQAVKTAWIWCAVILAFGLALFQLFPNALMSLFESGDSTSEITLAMTRMGVVALRIISLHFLIASVGICLSNCFQAIGKGTYSLIISLCRQLLVLLPAAWLLKQAFGTVDAVWWAFLIAELVSAVLSLLLYRKVDREIISRL